MNWELLGVWLVMAMVLPATANPILYGYVTHWRRSGEGRALMGMFVSLAALVDLAVLYYVLPWFPGKPIVAAGVYAAILVGMVRFTAILVRTLLEQRRESEES